MCRLTGREEDGQCAVSLRSVQYQYRLLPGVQHHRHGDTEGDQWRRRAELQSESYVNLRVFYHIGYVCKHLHTYYYVYRHTVYMSVLQLCVFHLLLWASHVHEMCFGVVPTQASVATCC